MPVTEAEADDVLAGGRGATAMGRSKSTVLLKLDTWRKTGHRKTGSLASDARMSRSRQATYRFNSREVTDTTRFVAATARVIGKRITYRQLIGKEALG